MLAHLTPPHSRRPFEVIEVLPSVRRHASVQRISRRRPKVLRPATAAAAAPRTHSHSHCTIPGRVPPASPGGHGCSPGGSGTGRRLVKRRPLLEAASVPAIAGRGRGASTSASPLSAPVDAIVVAPTPLHRRPRGRRPVPPVRAVVRGSAAAPTAPTASSASPTASTSAPTGLVLVEAGIGVVPIRVVVVHVGGRWRSSPPLRLPLGASLAYSTIVCSKATRKRMHPSRRARRITKGRKNDNAHPKLGKVFERWVLVACGVWCHRSIVYRNSAREMAP